MQEVTKDREKYIGGSDIPIIMGLSPFKTRWQLLREKAQLDTQDFSGNKYTEYGNELEPQMRDFINCKYGYHFVEDKAVLGDLRYHADGHDKEFGLLLEIKTTSHIHDDVSGYKLYLVQLLFGMQLYSLDKGLLAVYKRPDDFMPLFDEKNLKIYTVDMANYGDLMAEIADAVDSFRYDLVKLKENPLITDEELQPPELTELVNRLLMIEKELTAYKEIEKRHDELKKAIKDAMQANGIKTWTMNNGTKVTLIPDGEDTTVRKFDEKKFKLENPDEYEKYCESVLKKGRAGYVRITPPQVGDKRAISG